MSMIRVALLSMFLTLGCTHTSRTKSDTGYHPFSVVQGVTTDQSTVLRVVYPKYLKVNYKVVGQNNQSAQVKVTNHVEKKASPFAVDHVFVSGLKADERYTLDISSSDKRWNDQRLFKTLNLNKKEYSFLVASCMSDTFNELGDQMWPKVFSHNADLLFLIGDNIYADVFSGVYLGGHQQVNPSHLWNRYVDHAMTMKLYHMKNLIPVYATWDDHDFGVNDGGRNYPFKKQSKEIFNTFFPRFKNKSYEMGPGVSSRLSLNQINFFFMDGRYFRSKKKNKSGVHLGKKQTSWIMSRVDRPFNWLISGDQFFGSYHPYESFNGEHPVEFASFTQSLKDKNKKYFFLGGDRHLVEVMKIPKQHVGHETMEYTVSGIHTKMYPSSLKRHNNPLRVDGFDGKVNYALFQVSQEDKSLKVDFKAYSLNGLEIDLQNKL